MAQIQIFEPGLCCNTGICGVDVDEELITVSADLDWVRTGGGEVNRFNLAQEPLAFTDNNLIRAFLHTAGEEGLPVTLVDGMTVLTGRYPSRQELAKWTGLAVDGNAATQPAGSPRLLPMAQASGVGPAAESGACCGGADSCC